MNRPVRFDPFKGGSCERTVDYNHRERDTSSPLLRKLFKIMTDKQTNVCVAADKMSFGQVCDLIEKIGKYICMLKIHSEHLGGGLGLDRMLKILYDYKRLYNFMLFEDRKFFDGGATVQASYEALFAKYVDIVTVVPDCGDAIFDAIRKGAKKAVEENPEETRGCFAVCELSFKDVVRPDPAKLLQIAERNSDICVGIIAQKLQVTDKNNMIKATPGVNFNDKTDGSNQQWREPKDVIADGADICIVGRGITGTFDTEFMAIRFQEACYGKYNPFFDGP